MKGFAWFVVVVFSLLATRPADAQGARTTDVVVEQGTVHDGPVNITAGRIRIDGEVRGDVSAFRGEILIAGRVRGSVTCLTGTVQLTSTGRVDRSVDVINGTISVGGTINGAIQA